MPNPLHPSHKPPPPAMPMKQKFGLELTSIFFFFLWHGWALCFHCGRPQSLSPSLLILHTTHPLQSGTH